MSNSRTNFTCWLKKGDNIILPSDNVEVSDKLDAGAYNIKYSPYEDKFTIVKRTIKTDDLIDMPQTETAEIIDSIKDFCKQKEEFDKWGFVFKRGFLLYGVPGGGKTSIISNIIKYVTNELDGVVFIIYNEVDLFAYSKFISDIYRGIEPDRIILTIFEDIDGMTRDETLLINVLDGLGNSNNVLSIATTNYTERLSERIVNRPNRFDRRIEIKSPGYDARKFFFSKKILPEKLADIDIDKWVKETEGMTLAQLSEIVKSVFLLKNTFEDTISTLNDMKKVPQSSQYNKGGDTDNPPTGLGFQMSLKK